MQDEQQSIGVKRVALVVCAALAARSVQELVTLAQAEKWDVWVIATPKACAFIDEPLLCALTGHPVTVGKNRENESAKMPLASVVEEQADATDGVEKELAFLPDFTAVVVVPATFNTLKKWAQGVGDTLALQFLLHTNGKIPVLALPRASAELAQEPEFWPGIHSLRARGVHVYYEPEQYPPNNNVPWPEVMSLMREMMSIL